VTKDRLSVTVFLGDEGSRECKEGCLGQCIPQCLCQPVFDLPCLGVEATLDPVLGAVRLIALPVDITTTILQSVRER